VLVHRRELRGQQREEERLLREIERERARLAMEQAHYRAAPDRLRAGAGTINEAHRDRLEQQLAELDAAMAAVGAREADIGAGYVHVLSDIGAFGERMVTIGMIRRLEPMDRVHEPGDVSIPFRLRVHALIFSEDAAGLGRALHQEFEGHRVNLPGLRAGASCLGRGLGRGSAVRGASGCVDGCPAGPRGGGGCL